MGLFKDRYEFAMDVMFGLKEVTELWGPEMLSNFADFGVTNGPSKAVYNNGGSVTAEFDEGRVKVWIYVSSKQYDRTYNSYFVFSIERKKSSTISEDRLTEATNKTLDAVFCKLNEEDVVWKLHYAKKNSLGSWKKVRERL